MNCSNASSGLIPIFDPGVEWYAEEIESGNPFSFIRYGEGEWHVIIPDIPLKGKNLMWDETPGAIEELRSTLRAHHDHERYWPAIWHQPYLIKTKQNPKVIKWLKENTSDIKWHRGRVWRLAIEGDKFFHIVQAIRRQKLPIVFVGPQKIRCVEDKFSVSRFIEVPYKGAYHKRNKIERQILSFGKPAFIAFSVGAVSNILIHRLFPKIGDHSYLVDFGAVLEGLCGHGCRLYLRHMLKNPPRLQKNWEGK